MLWLKPATFAVCLLPLALAACGDSSSTDDPRTQPPLVRVATVVSAGDAARAFTGVVVARTQSDLGFRVQGKILDRLVDTGQTVKRGQPLMRLDPVDLRLQAHAQQQVVAAAKARARQTADDESRYRGLVSAGAVSASAYDQIKAAADTASAELSAAQAQANVAQNATDYALLLADADGVVMDTMAEPGQVIAAGQPVIRLARAGQREAIVQLPETLRPAIGSEALATLYGNAKQSVSARLRLLSDAADPVTRTFEARYVLGGELASAPLGSTVTLQLTENRTYSQIMQVPLAAIYDQGKGPGVWGISGKPAKVLWRPVQVIGVSDDAARVTGSLKSGEQVVALGAHLLREGEVVRMASLGVAGSQQ
ncbi:MULTISPECIES: efflux RND transporter periplasmic adaptor subunit [Enterobacter]|uniref:efflux RND transporter periplasmic adaptor subunit n=1 Tax=Enterobacter TaxID=547 RepID=UPI0028EF8EC0|nr:efflux RND transporter periplasmic adaptor subunit [Enterobacter cloacae]HDR2791740.1 efflux RND transporter periplasmic adaptor subunit [Enterobacter asburiae]WNT38430.1 efflux RND transporter periplasmic adaptor subunit [Enterobacter cloacae]HDR2796681.1 efflux RND transporter periplasmic adaptor subunit [Enterobacter asburiae]HDR2797147.1 efflux RND transporter periplasmic adaptor subunit [Enterobacter asburiae]HDR2802087.1 efflux RND transporter periplasmic adaptor subunit [Enterobacter